MCFFDLPEGWGPSSPAIDCASDADALLVSFFYPQIDDLHPLVLTTHPLHSPTALKFRTWLGGEHKINEYCHDLALRGGKRLAEILCTEVMDPNGEFTLNMVRTLHAPQRPINAFVVLILT